MAPTTIWIMAMMTAIAAFLLGVLFGVLIQKLQTKPLIAAARKADSIMSQLLEHGGPQYEYIRKPLAQLDKALTEWSY